MYLPLRLAEGYDIRRLDQGKDLRTEDLLQRSKPLVIRGAAGTGKTTCIRWLFRRLIQHQQAFPLIIELRRLARSWQGLRVKGKRRSLDAYLRDFLAEHGLD